MANETKYPLEFDCYKCGKTSHYPKHLKEGNAQQGAVELLKRCMTCGKENKVQVPEGYYAERNSSILRGSKNDV